MVSISENLVSEIFAGVGVLFGIASVVSIATSHPITAIPLAILAIGSEYASAIHGKNA